MADVATALKLPIILVSGIRLGCLNHSLLTYAATESKGCKFGGWIANLLSENNPMSAQNIAYLEHTLPIAYLGTIPNLYDNQAISQKSPLNINLLKL
jgi:dethiobiotin synthetase